MKNIEYMILLLTDEVHEPFDSGGADWEAMVHYNIACPYFAGDARAKCHGGASPNRDLCVECKQEWLEQEMDP